MRLVGLNKYVIGLDLGINNVGWSVIDYETGKIKKLGVAMYEKSSDAQERRSARAARRLRKRKLHRVERLSDLFVSRGIDNKRIQIPNMLEIRKKALEEKVDISQIVNIVYYIATHRGYIPFDDEANEREVIELDENTYPVDFLIEYHQKHGRFRGENIVIKEKDNVRELKAILNNQSDYYEKIDNAFINSIIKIVTSKREFYEGPGGPREDQLTKFGRYSTLQDLEEYKKNSNYNKYLYEKLIAHCKIFTEEKCAPMGNFFAEEFNFLNDFINMRIVNVDALDDEKRYLINDENHFTEEAIEMIENYILDRDRIIFKSMLMELFGIKVDDVEGYRIDKDGKPEFTKFDVYRRIKKSFQNCDMYPDWITDVDKTIYNKVVYVLTVCPSSTVVPEMLEDLINYDFSEDEIKVIKDIKQKGKLTRSQYHSLSEKALTKAIYDMRECNFEFNFMQISRKYDYEKQAREEYIKKYSKRTKEPYLMSNKFVDNLIASPQVKKTLRKSVKVINKIIEEQNDYPYCICVESTTEMNGKDKKSQIEKEQRALEKRRKEAIELLEENGKPLNEGNIIRVISYKENNGVCPYCGKPMSFDDAIRADIEHILPISKSFDDSQDNKTISCLSCNEEKGNRTPIAYLSTKGSLDEFRKRINNLKISEKKRQYFLYNADLATHEIKFINRNLRDTSYATSALVDELHKYKEYLIYKYPNTDFIKDLVYSVSTPGQLTTKTRRRLGMDEKTRETDYHHAVDASIVASIAISKDLGSILIKSQNSRQFWMKNKKLYPKVRELVEKFNLANIQELKTIKNEDINFSFEVKKSLNGKMADANISRVIKSDKKYKIVKQINLYELDFKNSTQKKNNIKLLDILFDETDKTKELLCQTKDRKLFNMLKKIYLENKDSGNNPFVEYCLNCKEHPEENFECLKDGIRKSSKSPVVKKIRYFENANEPCFVTNNNRYENNGQFTKNKTEKLMALTSTSMCASRIYYSMETSKFYFPPLYRIYVNQENGEIDTNNSYYKSMYQYFIGDNKVVKLIDVYQGSWVRVTKKDGSSYEGKVQGIHKYKKSIMFYLNGFTKGEKLKVSAFTSSDKRIEVFGVDILGNKYKMFDSNEVI